MIRIVFQYTGAEQSVAVKDGDTISDVRTTACTAFALNDTHLYELSNTASGKALDTSTLLSASSIEDATLHLAFRQVVPIENRRVCGIRVAKDVVVSPTTGEYIGVVDMSAFRVYQDGGVVADLEMEASVAVFSPCEEWVAVLTEDAVRAVSLPSLAVTTLMTHSGDHHGLCFVNEHQVLCSGKQSVSVLTVASDGAVERNVINMVAPMRYAFEMRYCSATMCLFVASQSRVLVLDVKEGFSEEPKKLCISSATFDVSADGKCLATANDTNVSLYPFDEGAKELGARRFLANHTNLVYEVRFTRDVRWILCACDMTIVQRNVTDGAIASIYNGYTRNYSPSPSCNGFAAESSRNPEVLLVEFESDE